MTQSSIRLDPVENTDLEVVCKPPLIHEAYHQDMETLSQKFSPSLMSHLKTLQLISKIIESNMGQLDEIQLQFALKNDLLELNMNLKGSPSSTLTHFLSQPTSTETLLSHLPSDNYEGFLRVGLSVSEDPLGISQFEKEKTEMTQNYLQYTEGVLNLYLLTSEKPRKALISIPIKNDGIDKALPSFLHLIREGYQAKITEQGSEQIQLVQFSKRKLHNTFLERDQWIGLGFESSESFRSRVLEIKSRQSPSSELLKIMS